MYIRSITYNGNPIDDLKLGWNRTTKSVNEINHRGSYDLDDSSLIVVDGVQYSVYEFTKFLRKNRNKIYNLCNYDKPITYGDSGTNISYIRCATNFDIKFRESLIFTEIEKKDIDLTFDFSFQFNDICNTFIVDLNGGFYPLIKFLLSIKQWKQPR